MNEPRVVESVTNECQSLGRAHESSSARAEQLIACLEGEIAKRDVELERLRAKTRTTMGVGSGDGQLFIHGDYESVKATQRIVIERDRLRAELSAAKETISRYETTAENCDLLRGELAAIKEQYLELAALSPSSPLTIAAPVSEAKAQGDAWAPSVNDYDHSIHSNPDAKEWADFFVATFPGLADKHDLMIGWFANAMMAMHDHLARKAQGMVMPERKTKADYGVYIGEFADEAAVIYNAALDEVTSLNAAPVQQVSVPDGWRELAKAVTALDQVPRSSGHAMPKPEQVRAEAAVIRAARAMLTAAPAAPAADAGHVFYGMDGNHP